VFGVSPEKGTEVFSVADEARGGDKLGEVERMAEYWTLGSFAPQFAVSAVLDTFVSGKAVGACANVMVEARDRNALGAPSPFSARTCR
jgi:hypothetical protein